MLHGVSVSVWLAAFTVGFALGHNTRFEGYDLSRSGYHLCAENQTIVTSSVSSYVTAYVQRRPCGGWLPWRTCEVTLYRVAYRSLQDTTQREVIQCCPGYEQVASYCALPLNSSAVFTAKPGSCPQAVPEPECDTTPRCRWDTDCPQWQKCCQASMERYCTDPEPPAGQGWCFNVTVTVKVDFQRMSANNETGLFNHTRLLHSVVSGALNSSAVGVYHVESWSSSSFTTSSSLLIGSPAPLALPEVATRLQRLLRDIEEVAAVVVQDVDECSHEELNGCPPDWECSNTEGSYECRPRPAAPTTSPTTNTNTTTTTTPRTTAGATTKPTQNVTCAGVPQVVRVTPFNVTGSSFRLTWAVEPEPPGDLTFQVLIMQGQTQVRNWTQTSRMQVEVLDLQPGVLYRVCVTPYTATCRAPGDMVEVMVKTEAKMLKAVSRLTNVEFTASLLDPDSPEYKNLSQSIEDEILQSLPPDIQALVDSGLVRVVVTGFSNGSVVVDFDLVFVPSESQDILAVSKSLMASLQNSSKYTVDASSSIIQDVNECGRGEVDCSPDAKCDNTYGGYECECQDGFQDNNPSRPGRSCSALPTQSPAMPTSITKSSTTVRKNPTTVPTTHTAAAVTTATTATMPVTITTMPVTITTMPTSTTTMPPSTTTMPPTTTMPVAITTMPPSTTTKPPSTTTMPPTITMPVTITTMPTSKTTMPPTITMPSTTTTTVPVTTTTMPPTTTTMPVTITTMPVTITTMPPTITTMPTSTTTMPTSTTTMPPTITMPSTTTTTVPVTTTTMPPTTTTMPVTITTMPPTITTMPTSTTTIPPSTTTMPTTTTTKQPTASLPPTTISKTSATPTTSAAPTASPTTQPSTPPTTADTPSNNPTTTSTTPIPIPTPSPTTTHTTPFTSTTTPHTMPTTTQAKPPTTSTTTSTTTTAIATTTTTEVPVIIRSSTISLECNLGYMAVWVARSFLSEKRMAAEALYLGVPECGVNNENSTHVELVAEWNGCGTQLSKNATHNIVQGMLYNSMELHTWPDGSQSVPSARLEVPILCTYVRNETISAGSANGYEMINGVVQGSGKFQVTVRLLNGSVPLPENYTLAADEMVMLEVSLNSSISQISVVLNRCWATESYNPQQQPQYTFLQNSCPVNEQYTTVLQNGNATTALLNVKIFSIVDASVDSIYLHCQIEICFRTGDDSCRPDCGEPRLALARLGNMVGTAKGSCGPFHRSPYYMMSEEQQNELLWTIGFSILGVGLVLLVVGAVVGAFFYKRRIGTYDLNIRPRQEDFSYNIFSTS